MERRYTLSFAELCDRLNIVIQKIIFAENEEMKLSFVKERDDIIYDINSFIKEGIVVTGEMLHAIMALKLINVCIWVNEDEQRKESLEVGGNVDWEYKYKKLLQSHKWNADRAFAKKRIQELVGGRIDHKLNYISGAFDFKW